MPTANFFARLKVDPDTGGVEGITISDQIDRLPDWPPEEEIEEDVARKNFEQAPRPVTDFESLTTEFEDSLKKFFVAIPAIIAIAPLTIKMFTMDRIKKYLQTHGEKIESGEVETYEIARVHIGPVNRMLDEMASNNEAVHALPQMLLMGLVSCYDEFFASLCRLIFLSRPEILSKSETNISFQDLVQIGSVEEARNQIIEKEIDGIMRQSHSDQVRWLEKAISIQDLKENENWKCIAEAFERRNLMAHNAGVVSDKYIENCKKIGCDLSNINVGHRIEVDAKYYKRAVRNFLEYGVKITQIVWRKILPDEIESAAKKLNSISYSLIENKRYKTASSLLQFGLYEQKKQGSDRLRKMMIVNLANAKTLDGDKKESIKILETEDWSSSNLDFQCCVAAVKGDANEVLRIIGPAIETNVLSIDHVRHWPVFLSIRQDVDFVRRFEEMFGENLLESRKVAHAKGNDAGEEAQHTSIAESEADDEIS